MPLFPSMSSCHAPMGSKKKNPYSYNPLQSRFFVTLVAFLYIIADNPGTQVLFLLIRFSFPQFQVCNRVADVGFDWVGDVIVGLELGFHLDCATVIRSDLGRGRCSDGRSGARIPS